VSYTTFDPSQPDDPINQVRMLTGDTADPFKVSDETIQYLLDQNNGEVQAVVLPCLQIISATYANLADKTVGRLSIQYSQQFKNYQEMITQWQKTRAATWRSSPGAVWLGGGGPKWLGDYLEQTKGYRIIPDDSQPPAPEINPQKVAMQRAALEP
jgi:hypothetical protein